MEAKSEKFQRLAEARVSKAISMLRSISKLSNRSHYEYSEEDVRRIFQFLRKELEHSKATFDVALTRDATKGFQLREGDDGK